MEIKNKIKYNIQTIHPGNNHVRVKTAPYRATKGGEQHDKYYTQRLPGILLVRRWRKRGS